MLGPAGAADDPLLGRVLMGRYRLTRVLGEGGMGKVYLAEHRLGNALRNVAVKALRAELSRDRQLVARFHRECETVVQLHHPNTVQFYDFGEIEGPVLFIVMEYIEGADLAERLERGPLPLPVIDKILIQICGSLHEAHQNGIVHRDLKPDNILLTQRGGQTDFVKVLDFGIAKNNQTDDSTARTQLTMQGMILGTPPYMSPEQFGSEPLDARSDIYSLGLITYEMLTGRLPFEARTPWEWATRHLTEPPRDIAVEQLGRALPRARRDAVMRALEKRRDLRQASAMEFLREFTGIGDTQTAWAVATSGAFEAVSMPDASAEAPAPDPPIEDDESPIVLPERRLRGAFIAAAMAALLGGAAALYWLADPSMADVGGAPPPPASPPLTEDALAAALPELPIGIAYEDSAMDVLPPEPSDDSQTHAPDAEESTREVEVVPAAPVKNPRRSPRPPRSKPPIEAPPAPAPPATPAPAPPATPSPSPSPTPSPSPSAPAPSEADLARADGLVAEARAAMNQQDLARAASKLQSARSLASSSHAGVRAATQELNTLGGRVTGNLLMRGRCDEAQALYRALRAANAHGSSGSNFAGEWCPRP